MKTVEDSLFVLHELGEQLKQQVDTSAAAAIQSGQLSLNQTLSSLEQALSRQQSALQVGIPFVPLLLYTSKGFSTHHLGINYRLSGCHSATIWTRQQSIIIFLQRMLLLPKSAPWPYDYSKV